VANTHEKAPTQLIEVALGSKQRCRFHVRQSGNGIFVSGSSGPIIRELTRIALQKVYILGNFGEKMLNQD
jgi:hypothetical protein